MIQSVQECCRNAHLCVYSTSRYGPFKIRSQIGRITGFNLPNFSSNEAWHRSDYLHLHWEDKCGKPWLTYCLWRRTSVLLLCRREQHRSCLWVGRCPCPSGSSGSPCPCWTHWKPSTCRLETEGEKKKRWEEGRQKTERNVEAWEAAIETYLWRRQISHHPSHRRRWCWKVDPSRSDWWPSGNLSAPCCYVHAKTTCPANHTHANRLEMQQNIFQDGTFFYN